MARVKLGFARLSVANKILTARAVVTQMTGNLSYPAPQPDLADVTTAIDVLEKTAQEALKGGTDKTLAKHIAEAALNDLMSQLQDYVQVASKATRLSLKALAWKYVQNVPLPPYLAKCLMPAPKWVSMQERFN